MIDINDIPQVEHFMGMLAGAMNAQLQVTFDKPVGFAIILFDMGQPGVGNYVSNANREDMVKTLREVADRIEKNEAIPQAIGSIQ